MVYFSDIMLSMIVTYIVMLEIEKLAIFMLIKSILIEDIIGLRQIFKVSKRAGRAIEPNYVKLFLINKHMCADYITKLISNL